MTPTSELDRLFRDIPKPDPLDSNNMELSMPKFRKKPVVIEASQWKINGDHPLDYSKGHLGLENDILRTFSADERRSKGWEGDVVRYFRRPDVDGERLCTHCDVRMHDHGWIETLEGGHIVCPGDWIITGVHGEHYPCKPDIFAATYERVDADETNHGPCAQGDCDE